MAGELSAARSESLDFFLSEQLKIAHLAMSALPRSIGGLQVVVDQLARAQTSQGHDVSLITRWKDARSVNLARLPYRALALPPQKSFSSIPFRSVGAKWPVASAVKWHQMRRDFDLWHIHWLYPTGWMAFDTLEAMGVPALVTAHGADINVDAESGYGYRQFESHENRVKILAPKLSAVSAITPSARQTLLQLGVRNDAIFDIPNGVDAKRLAECSGSNVRQRLGIGSATQIVLSVGRNDPNKGFHHAVEILSELVAQGIDAVWVFVGKDTGNLRELFEKAGLAERVRLHPPITGKPGADYAPPAELAELYAAADVLVSTSAGEGFGLTLLEAMACKTPAVGFDVAGVRDVIAHDVDGLLSKHGDLAGMSAAIASILTDHRLSSRLGKAGAAKAMRYDWSQIAAEYLTVYQSMLAGGGR